MSSLIRLAETKNLPYNQYMDQETLDWIISNKIIDNDSLQLYLDSEDFQMLQSRCIPSGWFLSSERIGSIHGARHLLRVAINGLNLIRVGFASPSLHKIIIVSSILHDLKRACDKDDPKHAIRAAKWFKENINEVERVFFPLSIQDKNSIYYSILLHELNLEDASNNFFYQKYKDAIDLLKISDALDRYRLPKLKWWPNLDMLPKQLPKDSLWFAYQLVIRSEQRSLEGLDDYSSVFDK